MNKVVRDKENKRNNLFYKQNYLVSQQVKVLLYNKEGNQDEYVLYNKITKHLIKIVEIFVI